MRSIKMFVLSINIFFVFQARLSMAVEKDVIREWIKEDTEGEAIGRLDKLAGEREKAKAEAAKSRIKRLYTEAQELVKLKKDDEALEKYREILSLNPGEVRAEEYIAKLEGFKKISSDREARKILTQQEKEKGENYQRLSREGAELYRKKQYKEAGEKWEEALKYDPGNESLKTWVDRCRMKEIEKTKEEVAFEKGLEEKAALAAIEEAYLPKRRVGAKGEAPEAEKVAKEEGKKKLEEMLEKVEIALQLQDVDLRKIVNEISIRVKEVSILVDWTTISEATGVSMRVQAPAEGKEAEEVKEEAKPAESGEIKTMHLDLIFYNPMPLKSLLDYLMTITRLQYRVEEHAVIISTKEALEKEDMVVKVYKLKYGMTKLRPVTLKPLGKEEEK